MNREVSMQIKFVSVMVEDQNHALEFYTSVLGFRKMADIPMGEFRQPRFSRRYLFPPPRRCERIRRVVVNSWVQRGRPRPAPRARSDRR